MPQVSNLLPRLLHDNQSNFVWRAFSERASRCGLDDMDTNFAGYRSNIKHDDKTQGFFNCSWSPKKYFFSPG